MQQKTTWLIANWKMHGNRQQVRGFAAQVNAALASAPSAVQVVFCPPSLYLDAARSALPQNGRLQLGGQDCHGAAEGAFTGDISAAMLAESGAAFVIIGHSERRQAYQETNGSLQAKRVAAQAAGLIPIFCIGETLAEYEAGETAAILAAQLAPVEGVARVLVAYEPIWAIGTGKTPTVAEIDAAHRVIKSILGSAALVLYGGSVKPTNVAEILAIASVDGVLIGGASLQAEAMQAMIATA